MLRQTLSFCNRSGDKRTAKILVDHGARLNIRNKDGETPLHLAADNARDQGGEVLAGLVTFLVQRWALTYPVVQ